MQKGLLQAAKGLVSGADADLILDDSSKKPFRAAQNLMRKLAVSQFCAKVSVLELKSELACLKCGQAQADKILRPDLSPQEINE